MYIADLTTFNIRKEQYSTVQAVQLYEYAAGTEQHTISCMLHLLTARIHVLYTSPA